jgi:hypothetical protein
VSRLKNIRTLGGDREQTKMQDYVSNALIPLVRNPLLGGLLLKGVQLSSGTNFVNHRLGRPLQGWVLTRKKANVTVWDDQDNNTNVSTTLKLETSGAITVDIYVF